MNKQQMERGIETLNDRELILGMINGLNLREKECTLATFSNNRNPSVSVYALALSTDVARRAVLRCVERARIVMSNELHAAIEEIEADLTEQGVAL